MSKKRAPGCSLEEWMNPVFRLQFMMIDWR